MKNDPLMTKLEEYAFGRVVHFKQFPLFNLTKFDKYETLWLYLGSEHIRLTSEDALFISKILAHWAKIKKLTDKPEIVIGRIVRGKPEIQPLDLDPDAEWPEEG